AALRARFGKRVNGITGVRFTDGYDLAQRYAVADWADPHGDALGGMPYRESYYAALGTEIMRGVDRMQRPPLKVVVADADNTLWAGVVGEDGVAGLRIPAGMRALQERLRALRQTGGLLAVCSKNVEADVVAVLTTHPDMTLRRDDFVALKADWRAKPGNVVELATELGLGLDSFVFVDD